ncbi:hypothetical protein DL240_06515 [Lujinxingia litoralis]|uniref:Cyclic nucleotide-binding domain-containing protein n=1 Tax=Lujinxingia litoralis TaxID=2211119 RepID=A0A328C9H8_9DELT|nr:hypothetical protein DL240_06515 [Lujinxingia litoralis]
MEGAARRKVATPVPVMPERTTAEASWGVREGSGVRVQALSAREAEQVRRGEAPAIALKRPKSGPRVALRDEVTRQVPQAEMLASAEPTREVSSRAGGSEDVTRAARPATLAPSERPGVEARGFEWEGLDLGEEGDARAQRAGLPEIPLFSQLPAEAFVEALRVMEHRRVAPGTVLSSPDDPEVCLYIIIRGEVRVEKALVDGRTKFLARLGEGEVFGEFRLLTGRDRMARVVAERGLEVLAVRDEVVFELGRRFPEVWEALWGFYYARMLNNLLASSAMFGSLTPAERAWLSGHFELHEYVAGQALFERGQHVERLALIVSGSAEVEVSGRRGQREVVDALDVGAFLGVTPCALLEEAGASVRASTDVITLEMPGEVFRELLSRSAPVAEEVRREVALRRERSSRARSRSYAAEVAPLLRS